MSSLNKLFKKTPLCLVFIGQVPIQSYAVFIHVMENIPKPLDPVRQYYLASRARAGVLDCYRCLGFF